MSWVNAEAMESIQAQYDAAQSDTSTTDSGGEEAQAGGDTSEAPGDQQGEAADEATTEGEASDGATTEVAGEEGSRTVPLAALHESRRREKEFKRQLDEMKEIVEELKKTKPNGREAEQESDDQWLAKYLGRADEAGIEVNESDPLVQMVRKQQEVLEKLQRSQYEVDAARAKQSVMAEIAEVRRTYPDVSEEALLREVVADHGVDLWEKAEVAASFISKIRTEAADKAVADYKAKLDAEAKSTPPRARMSGSSARIPGGALPGDGKPTTIEAASARLRQMLARGESVTRDNI